MKPFLLFCIAAVSACTALDLGNNSNFKMTTPNTFQFDDVANPLEPAGSSIAEQKRIARLEAYLRLNKACLGGYEVTNRSQTTIGQFGAATAVRVFYEGRCK